MHWNSVIAWHHFQDRRNSKYLTLILQKPDSQNKKITLKNWRLFTYTDPAPTCHREQTSRFFSIYCLSKDILSSLPSLSACQEITSTFKVKETRHTYRLYQTGPAQLMYGRQPWTLTRTLANISSLLCSLWSHLKIAKCLNDKYINSKLRDCQTL